MLSLLTPLTRRLLLSGLGVLLIVIYLLSGRSSRTTLVTAQVTRGPILRTVSATGTVNPVITVQVGSYVSGPIQAIYADFNAPVKKGQLIAKIDPRPFEVKLQEVTATLDNARAQLLKDQADAGYKGTSFRRQAALLKTGAVSRDAADSALSTSRQAAAQVELDKANIKQQQANVKDAQVQLDYTNITSPVDGTVVSRNVDVGQTVAASFQTPTLFLIAKDLTQMQVDTNVSESDIGNVQPGQSATFRVDAYPDRQFEGTIRQVRQAPITVQNVVTYDVVVDVPNAELLLKPGMTANLTIVTAKRDAVLRVPVQALRYKPQGSDGSRRSRADEGSDGRISRHSRVWVLDGTTPRAVPIVTGLDDGSFVEVRSGEIQPGEMVVTDERRPTTSKPSQSSPLSPGFRMR